MREKYVECMGTVIRVFVQASGFAISFPNCIVLDFGSAAACPSIMFSSTLQMSHLQLFQIAESEWSGPPNCRSSNIAFSGISFPQIVVIDVCNSPTRRSPRCARVQTNAELIGDEGVYRSLCEPGVVGPRTSPDGHNVIWRARCSIVSRGATRHGRRDGDCCLAVSYIH